MARTSAGNATFAVSWWSANPAHDALLAAAMRTVEWAQRFSAVDGTPRCSECDMGAVTWLQGWSHEPVCPIPALGAAVMRAYRWYAA